MTVAAAPAGRAEDGSGPGRPGPARASRPTSTTIAIALPTIDSMTSTRATVSHGKAYREKSNGKTCQIRTETAIPNAATRMFAGARSHTPS